MGAAAARHARRARASTRARVIIGHSCGSSDAPLSPRACSTAARMLGFDRFGLEILHPDRERLAVLIGLLGIGFERQLVLSHDTVWCWRGRAPRAARRTCCRTGSRRTFRDDRPALREAGVSQAEDRRRCWSRTRAAISRKPRSHGAESASAHSGDVLIWRISNKLCSRTCAMRRVALALDRWSRASEPPRRPERGGDVATDICPANADPCVSRTQRT